MAPIPNRGDKRAFFDIDINGEPAGRIVFGLWNFECPRTVENFRVMCTGEMGELFGRRATYERSIIHRVIKGFMIQGGDITKRNGQGGFSIYGSTFDDENLNFKHNKPFLLSMANRGHDTNGSQFFITTEELPHLDGKHCVFGEVIKGFEVVTRIENLSTGENDMPEQKVQIVHCGEMIRKGDAESSGREGDMSGPVGVKMDNEPETRNWLMRRSRSPEDRQSNNKKKDRKGRNQSPERRRRNSRDRNDRNDRSRRSRSRSPIRGRRDERRDERRPVLSKDGVKVRGRGKLTFIGARTRSVTPPHWKREEGKKQTLEAHQKKMEEEEERKKQTARREKLEAEQEARLEREKLEREAQRELDRQKNEARRELERQEKEEDRNKSSRRSSSSKKSDKRSGSSAEESEQENRQTKSEKRSASSSSSSSSSARSSASGSGSGSSSGSDSD